MWINGEQTLEIFEVNAAAIASYGYSRRRFLSMALRDLRPPQDEPVLSRAQDILQRVDDALRRPVPTTVVKRSSKR